MKPSSFSFQTSNNILCQATASDMNNTKNTYIFINHRTPVVQYSARDSDSLNIGQFPFPIKQLLD